MMNEIELEMFLGMSEENANSTGYIEVQMKAVSLQVIMIYGQAYISFIISLYYPLIKNYIMIILYINMFYTSLLNKKRVSNGHPFSYFNI